jgi:hypothetical protein
LGKTRDPWKLVATGSTLIKALGTHPALEKPHRTLV